MIEREHLVNELKKSFDSYEVCFLKERTKRYESFERELYGLVLKEEEGIALRAIKDHRLVFSYTYETGEKAPAALVENAVALVPFMDADEHVTFPERYGAYPTIEAFDAAGLETQDSEKTSRVLTLERTILDHDKRIVQTRNCELQEVKIESTIFNANGLQAEAHKTIYTLGGFAVAANGEEVSWYDWSWSHVLDELEPASLGRRIAEKVISFLGGKVLQTGVYEGLLTPGAACDILSVLAPSFLGESLYKDKTWLKERVGQQCFSPLLNITDSGLVGMGSFPFDGEGVPSQENALVREGAFQGFLFDTYYGRKLGKPSTGNGVRGGIKEPPKCSPRGFYIEKGREDVAGAFQDGIVIEELMGTHTANTVTGDFSVGALGHICKNGERKPFKGVIFSGNLFELLKNVRAVGNDLTFYGGIGSPSLHVSNLKISGT
jgi:PmbA protein